MAEVVQTNRQLPVRAVLSPEREGSGQLGGRGQAGSDGEGYLAGARRDSLVADAQVVLCNSEASSASGFSE